MRTITMVELDAFIEAAQDLGEKCYQLSKMCEAVPAIAVDMLWKDPLAALGAAIEGSRHILEEYERACQQFDRAAYNFLGEGRRPGELPKDFFDRICGMSKEELLATPAKNGLRLQL